MSTNEHYLISDFKRFIATDTLAQSYIFFGESYGARTRLGKTVLQLLEGGGTMPIDGMVIEKDREGTIGIDAVRGAIIWLWQSPLRAMRKSVFVVDGEAMTLEAQNALLKVVEEPPSAGLIMMSVKDPSALIAPLVSRCERVYVSAVFAPPEKQTEREAAMEQLGKKFVLGNAAARKKIIGDLLKNEGDLENFIRAILMVCRRDPMKHVRLMAATTDRWANMSQFNTNKKLQLETLLEL
jgi:DNA polymerase III delta prime subunit